MLRNLFFAILVAVPTSLVTWMITRGVMGEPGSRCSKASLAAEAEATKDPNQVMAGFLETPLGEFQLVSELAFYDNKGLFEYINGGAPQYLERGFRQLAAIELKEAGGGELVCDLYDMGSPKNAEAIFVKEKSASAKEAPYGDAGHLGSMALVFRKAGYYVKLTAFDEQAEKTLPVLANLLLERMP